MSHYVQLTQLIYRKQLSAKSLLNFVLVCIGIYQKIEDTSIYIVYRPILFI